MKVNLLFVCMANVNRSVAFERYYKAKLNPDKFDVRGAGIYSGYPFQVNKELIDWADYIFVMDLEQEKFIREKYGSKTRTHIIGVSDQYDVDAPALLDIIKYWDETYFNEWVRVKMQ